LASLLLGGVSAQTIGKGNGRGRERRSAES